MADYVTQSNAMSIRMRDGTVYESRGGNVHVDSPRHVREIESSSQLSGGYIERKKAIFSNAEGVYCDRCNFHAFKFSRRCPRCGNQLQREN